MLRHRRSAGVAALLTLAVIGMGPGFLSAQRDPLSKSGAPGPSKVTVVGGATSVLVSWTPVESPGVTYRVLRGLDARAQGVDITRPVDIASVVDPNVVPGTTYFYQVVAVYPDGTTGAAASVVITFAGAGIAQPAALPTGVGKGQPVGVAPIPPGNLTPITPQPGRLPPGPPPQAVTVSGIPLVARLAWKATPNASRYAVYRNDGTGPSVERTPAGFTGIQFQDQLPDPRPTYMYTVVAYYADGTWGESPAVPFISPPLVNPAGFTASHLGGGNVAFKWQVVPGAAQYRLDGPGLPNTGRHQTATAVTIAGIPPGPGTWKVTALYPGNFADYATGTLAQAMVRVLPSRTTPWLAKNNGSGSLAIAQAHSSQICGTLHCLEAVQKLPGKTQPPFIQWGDPFKEWPYNQARQEAVYGNTGDLGFGRRTDCKQWFLGPPVPGFLTICYATSHGPQPGASGFGNPQVITAAADGVNFTFGGGVLHDPWGGMPRSATMIIQNPMGTTFLAMTPGVWDLTRGAERGGLSWWPDWIEQPQLTPAIALDTEGPKFVPHSCIACHGGRYNPSTNRVDGASLLPLDPGLLVFSGSPPGGAEYQAEWTRVNRLSEEEKIRKINLMVANSSASAAVKNYVYGLYNGAVAQPGAQAVSDYVPAGWAPQAGFYRSVVRPYCAMCHLAAPAHVSFSSWGNFQQNAAAIHTAVCKTRTMPHAEIAFTQFWLKDTGALFLPGLLATTLGFPSCP